MKQVFSWLWGLVLDGFEALRDFFRNLKADLKDSSRFFKIKLALITGYLVVGAATVIIFIPPGELNEIDAKVRTSRTEIVGGRYFLVGNHSTEVWKNVVLTMNSSYTTRWPRLRPGKKKAFFFNRFRDKTKRKPSEDIQVRNLRIDCQNGSFLRDYTKNR
jgi:hypothetical protein